MSEEIPSFRRSIEKIISSMLSNCVDFGMIADPHTELDEDTINSDSDALDALINILEDWLDYYDQTGKKIKLHYLIDEKINYLYGLQDSIATSKPRLGRRMLNDYLDRYYNLTQSDK